MEKTGNSTHAARGHITRMNRTYPFAWSVNMPTSMLIAVLTCVPSHAAYLDMDNLKMKTYKLNKLYLAFQVKHRLLEARTSAMILKGGHHMDYILPCNSNCDPQTVMSTRVPYGQYKHLYMHMEACFMMSEMLSNLGDTPWRARLSKRPAGVTAGAQVLRVVKARNHVSGPEFRRGILSVSAFIRKCFFRGKKDEYPVKELEDDACNSPCVKARKVSPKSVFRTRAAMMAWFEVL